VTYQITKSKIDVQAPVPVQVTTTAASPAATVAAAPTSQAPKDSTIPAFSRSTVPPATLASNKTAAEQAYDLEIGRLQAILVARRTQLDTTTVRVVEKNLKVIDDAIAQCKAALQRDPASRFLIESLNDALDTKVQLLRTAAQLPSRS
jgi:hypothetical protein